MSVLDTKMGDSYIKKKLAVEFNTIPQFLSSSSSQVRPMFYLEDSEEMKMRKSLSWSEVKDTPLFETSEDWLRKLYVVCKIRTVIKDGDFDNITVWGSSSNGLRQALGVTSIELEKEDGIVTTITELLSEWDKREETILIFKTMVENNLKDYKKEKKVLEAWKGVKINFDTTSFVLNKINYETTVPNVLGKNELIVFDSIRLNNVIVACFYRDLIKYNQEHVSLVNEYFANLDKTSPPLEKTRVTKTKQVDDASLGLIQIMLNVKEMNLVSLRTKYKFINIYVDNKNITFIIDTLINEPSVVDKLKILIKNILDNMNQLESYNKREEREFVYGSYTAMVNIPIVVLKELATNDPNVYSVAYINEGTIINTRKTSVNLYLRQEEFKIGVNISYRTSPDRQGLQPEGMVVRLKKIPGTMKNRVSVYSDLVNKILKYASDKTSAVMQYYGKYIELKYDLGLREPVKIVKDRDNSLRLEEPNIFLPNYTKLCNKPPIIIRSEDEADEALDWNASSPFFSRDEMKLKYPKEPSYPKVYKCPYPTHKYPGVKKNTNLPNKDVFPFIPCCYQKPQSKSKNSKLYYSQELYKQRINSSEIGKTSKIQAPNRIGTLPHRVDKLLNYVAGSKFYRYGIPVSKTSCLTILNMVTYNREKEVDIRAQLAKRAALCKPQFTSLSVRELKNKILNPDTYISPRYFKNALEDYYQISYILFSKENDDFATYPSKFVRFTCPLKNKVVFVIEHETHEHVELIVDAEMTEYVNRQTKRPIFTFDKNDPVVESVFTVYKERFGHMLYDVESSSFNAGKTFKTYPWERDSARVNLLSQYVDGYGQTRLVEFEFEDLSFVAQFPPLPCLQLSIRNLDYFTSINKQLTVSQIELLKKQFEWCELYTFQINTEVQNEYYIFKKIKKLAEYIMWAACHAYANFYFSHDRNRTLDFWITHHTTIVPQFTYAAVTVSPIFVLHELMVNNKFIFNSVEMSERVRFNISLLSEMSLRMCESNIYRTFYKDADNFSLVHPEELALSKQEYFQRNRESYVLNILTTENLKYINTNTLYFVKELFGQNYSILCLFLSSFEKLFETANKILRNDSSTRPYTLHETLVNVTLFDQNVVEQYVVGRKRNTNTVIHVISLNINEKWFHGLVLPNLFKKNN